MISTEPVDSPSPLGEHCKTTDSQILYYIWSVVEKYRERKEQNSMECILCEQKLVHLSLIVQERDPEAKFNYELGEELIGLVQKINKLAMEQMGEHPDENQAKFISKAVDIVMLPGSSKVVPYSTLAKLKVLTFNNLACVLKKNRHMNVALKAVSFALELELQLIGSKQHQEHYDIVATFLNKAAILSDMGKHSSALEQIRKASALAERISVDVERQLKSCDSEELVRQLQEKRHYGLYMKMLVSYSIGVQKQHQKLISSAVGHYQESKRLAIMIDNQFMAGKLEGIIAKLRKE